MLSSNIPAVFNIPWANSATAPYVHAVPEASQVSITPGAASLTTGFPPLNFQSYTAGGIPPFGNDLNGILNQITAWLRWSQAGGFPKYTSTFQTAIGGYPSGAIVQSATVQGKLWCSSTESNVTNPAYRSAVLRHCRQRDEVLGNRLHPSLGRQGGSTGGRPECHSELRHGDARCSNPAEHQCLYGGVYYRRV